MLRNILRRIASRYIPRKLYAKHLDSLVSALLCNRSFHLLDLGAQGGLQPRWAEIARFLEVSAVDPNGLADSDNNKGLSRQNEPSQDMGFGGCRYFNPITDILGPPGAKMTFSHTSDSRLSSLLEPKIEFLSQFPNASRFDVVEMERISTKSVDELALHNVDFIKLDLQGAEALVLQDGKVTLQKCMGIEVEVEFLELYKGQALFGEVSSMLLQEGFIFHDFTNLCRWNRRTLVGDGQCVFGDALFIRDIGCQKVMESLSDESYIALMIILVIYRRFDIFSIIAKDRRFSSVCNRMEIDNKLVMTEFKKLLSFHLRAMRLNRRFSDGLGFMGPGYYNHFMY
jgi:hypothetical protein